MKLGIEGYYRLRVFRPDGRLKEDTGWFHNLITDIGLDAIAQQADVMSHYTVGTSSTPPAVTDTWVGAFVATSDQVISSVTGVGGTGPYYGYRRQTIRFDPGEATGNLSEVCVGWSATTGTAFSRELTRDGAGATKTITVLAEEYLEFTYELRYHVPSGDFTGSCTIGVTPHNFTLRAAAATNPFWWADSIGKLFTFNNGNSAYHYAYAGAIGAITGEPSGQGGTGTTSITVTSYNPGDKYRDFSVTANSTQWNVAGGQIQSLVLGCKGNRWQAQFSPTIAKSGVGSLTIQWRISWDRTP